MAVEFDKRFLTDLKQIRDKGLRARIKAVIIKIEKVSDISSIGNLKKLEKYVSYYRIKIKFDSKRDYRMGMIIRGNKVWLIRCLPRTRIYKKFP